MEQYNFTYLGIDFLTISSDVDVLSNFKHGIEQTQAPSVDHYGGFIITVVLAERFVDDGFYEKKDVLVFDENKKYFFIIKDFKIYLDTESHTITMVADKQSLLKYAANLFIDLYFKIFSKANSIMLHSGLIYKNDRYYILCGESGQGKSTTCARSLSYGFDFLSDEVVMLYFNKNNLVLYTQEHRLRIRHKAIETFAEIKSIVKKYDCCPEAEGILLYGCNERKYITTTHEKLRCVCIEKGCASSENFLIGTEYCIRKLIKSIINLNPGSYLEEMHLKSISSLVKMFLPNLTLWRVPDNSACFIQDLCALEGDINESYKK